MKYYQSYILGDSLIKKLTLFALLAAAIFFVGSCTKKQSTEPTPDPIKVVFSMAHSHDIITPGTVLRFTINGLTAADDAAEYEVQYDWNSDGVNDTDWQSLADTQKSLMTIGKNLITVTIRNLDGATTMFKDSIYVCELVQVTPNDLGHNVWNIDWSKDGTNRIAYETPLPGHMHRIFTFTYPGGTAEQVTLNTENKTNAFFGFPKWSSDCNKIAFAYKDSDTGLLSPVKYIDINTDLVVPIKDDFDLTVEWAPDGSGVLLNAAANPGFSGSNLYYHDFAADTNQIIAAEPGHAFCWSPTGDVIAYYKLSEYGSIVRFLDFASRTEIKQFPINGSGAPFEWSPDGNWITLGFTHNNDQTGIGHILHVLNYTTGKIYTVKSDALLFNDGPSWSDDGSLIGFTAKSAANPDIPDGIWAYRFPSDL